MAIAIPTHEYGGQGAGYLSRLLNTIATQTFQDFSIFISDQSTSGDIQDVVNSYSSQFDIAYSRNDQKDNPTQNINTALRMAQGDIVKVMFMDDFFYATDALAIIKDRMEGSDAPWAMNSIIHYTELTGEYHRNMEPYWNPQMLSGANSLGSPSSMSYRKDIEMPFDEYLRMFVDVELYCRYHEAYGPPLIIPETLTVSCFNMAPSATDRLIENNDEYVKLYEQEKEYCRNKHARNL